VVAGGVLVTLLGLVLAEDSLILGVLMCLAIIGLTALMAFGAENVAIGFLVLAFVTAPAYRGLQALSGGLATPTDLCLVAGLVLLLPTVLRGHLRLPPPYVIGVSIVAFFGLVASLFAESIIFSIFSLLQWMFFLAVLPIVIAWWRPGVKVVVTLLWAYVVGQSLSLLDALAEGPTVGNRYQGLSHHINAFGMAGMTAMVILMYLYHYHRSAQAKAIVVGTGLAMLASVVMSGSRAALVVAAVIIVVSPLVERSAISGVGLGFLGLGGLIALPLLIQSGHAGSAITRLTGDATAKVADQARGIGLDEGFRRLRESPILGGGLGDVEVIHNVFLEVAAGIGLIGLGGYLVVMFVMSRPLIMEHPHRRLAYLPLAWVGMAPALPSLYDRTMWVPVSLSILVVISGWPDGEQPVEEIEEPAAVAERPAPIIVSY
jgi:hypothetical protein